MASDVGMQPFGTSDVSVSSADPDEKPDAAASELALVKKLQDTIRDDKRFHEAAFKQMREDMYVARFGCLPSWPRDNYRANLAGRHVKQKTAALYAKNPRVVATRRETLDFAVWDEDPKSLEMAFGAVQMAQQITSATQTVDPVTGQPTVPEPPPEQTQAFQAAMATIQDYQQGMARRQQIEKIGRTLEVVFMQAMREQKPVDFKTGAKQLVRRTCTTGVGYIELGFQRELGPRAGLTEQLADARSRLDHLKALAEDVQEGEITEDDAEIAELQQAMAALQAEPDIVLREGLIIDFPQSTRVIPDKLCRNLVGFIGARHVTVEYLFTVEQVEEMFGVDLGEDFTGYIYSSPTESTSDSVSESGVSKGDNTLTSLRQAGKGHGLALVWKHYDKNAGLTYYMADGYKNFLRPPAAPDVFVEDFWPIYALTFNAVESEDALFPPSDVYLMTHQQMEYNRSRQGMRDHRYAARPRWVYGQGTLEDDDVEAFGRMKPFEARAVNLPQGAKIGDVLEAMPVPGVDPNLYETGQLFTDIQLVVGSSEAQFGGTAQATATESAIAAGSSKSADDAATDDLDAFLSTVARASSQILLKEMSAEQVKLIAGPGALWPEGMSLGDISAELFLEVEAGSSGKPNQAVAVQNFERMAPILLQTPGISPTWLAREGIKRLDDKADMTKALTENIPAIVAQNRMQQVAPADPNADPTAQGPSGGDKGPPAPPEQQPGSSASFGSNQV